MPLFSLLYRLCLLFAHNDASIALSSQRASLLPYSPSSSSSFPSSSSSPASSLSERQDLTCPLFSLPCSADTTCFTGAAGGRTALCCPVGSDCSTIQPMECGALFDSFAPVGGVVAVCGRGGGADEDGGGPLTCCPPGFSCRPDGAAGGAVCAVTPDGDGTSGTFFPPPRLEGGDTNTTIAGGDGFNTTGPGTGGGDNSTAPGSGDGIEFNTSSAAVKKDVVTGEERADDGVPPGTAASVVGGALAALMPRSPGGIVAGSAAAAFFAAASATFYLWARRAHHRRRTRGCDDGGEGGDGERPGHDDVAAALAPEPAGGLRRPAWATVTRWGRGRGGRAAAVMVPMAMLAAHGDGAGSFVLVPADDKSLPPLPVAPSARVRSVRSLAELPATPLSYSFWLPGRGQGKEAAMSMAR